MALSKFNPQLMHDDQLLPATLLEMGDTLNFIETRKHTLRNEIKTSKIDAGVGKVSGLAGIAGGGALLILSNPLGSLIVAGGAIAYSMAVFAQWLQTGKVQIMPLSSKTQAERDVELSSSTETGNAYDVSAIQGQRDSIREDAAYLSDREKVEYELLHFSPEGLMSAMNHVHPTQRWACYQFLIDAFLAGTIQSYFANPQALRDVLGNPQIYTSHLPEASKRFPQYGLQSAGAIRAEDAIASFQPAAVPTIGANTRLNAVEVQSSPMIQSVASMAQKQGTEDIAKSLAEHLQSTLIVGQPGAGKGLTIAYATRWIKQLHPDCQIWAIDPKSDPAEADYWKMCDRLLQCPIRPFTPAEDMEAIQDAIDNFIAEFQNSHAPMKLLIFDEALAVKEKTGKWFKGLMAGFNALCSMGRSSKQYGWLVSQSPNTDDFGISGGTRNVYRRVLLLAKSNQGLIANRSTFFSGEPTQSQLNETGRVYFDSITNSWGITPVYPDLVRDVPANSEPRTEPKSRRISLESLMQSTEAEHPIEQFYHSDSVASDEAESDSSELAIRAEIKRFLLANSEGSKPRDLSNKARSPVRKMPVEEIKLYLDVMTLENEIYEVDGTYFANSN
ncbi:MAG: ATP-binding protein [Leptolyngbya sp. UWPOB_LEPTO1]|uniref:ATP-binding protein n=1 Tax=Leptolyngbya sp. UWPOB_LEPTO1 TaxID=2815653 RepID=UPI001AC5306F|nr:ATP-binding protein [Leptolyngbya sp. UWPOB_LEPTO1]MBN8563433.1 ATP-binding protein [Leptolyngbya sp. UWPOB_LEPTO1]